MDYDRQARADPLRADAAGGRDALLGHRALRRRPADAGRRALGAVRPQPRRLARRSPRSSGGCGSPRAARSAPAAARAAGARPGRRSGRFAAQPRLRLAWAIAFARSAFWVTFFIYIPILMLEGGLGAAAGGLAVAAGNLMLFNNLFARRWASRHSLRRVLGGAFLAAAVLTLAAGLLGLRAPAMAGAAMVAAAFFVALIDGLGPVAFLRAVRGARAGADDHRLPHLPRRLRAAAAARLLLPLRRRRLRRSPSRRSRRCWPRSAS